MSLRSVSRHCSRYLTAENGGSRREVELDESLYLDGESRWGGGEMQEMRRRGGEGRGDPEDRRATSLYITLLLSWTFHAAYLRDRDSITTSVKPSLLQTCPAVIAV